MTHANERQFITAAVAATCGFTTAQTCLYRSFPQASEILEPKFSRNSRLLWIKWRWVGGFLCMCVFGGYNFELLLIFIHNTIFYTYINVSAVYARRRNMKNTKPMKPTAIPTNRRVCVRACVDKAETKRKMKVEETRKKWRMEGGGGGDA